MPVRSHQDKKQRLTDSGMFLVTRVADRDDTTQRFPQGGFAFAYSAPTAFKRQTCTKGLSQRLEVADVLNMQRKSVALLQRVVMRSKELGKRERRQVHGI